MEMNTTTERHPMPTTKPLVYSEADKVATPVDTDELRDLIAQDDNPDIFRRKGTIRRVGWNLRIEIAGTNTVYIIWDCAYGDGLDVATPTNSRNGWAPIFHFERLGRIVRWEVK